MASEVNARLKAIQDEAEAVVAAVRDDPQGRIAIRKGFYRSYGESLGLGPNDFGLGNSELAFMQWEVDRGVLNPLNASRPGSRWWRAVNERFLYFAEVAKRVFESGETLYGLSKPTRAWMRFLANPSEKTWYRAHNTSIIHGYLAFQDLADRESTAEKLFLNEVLYRLLYAQAMVEDKTIFGDFGVIGANPRLPAVDVMVSLPAFYPQHCPLTAEDILNIRHSGDSIGDGLVSILDEDIILPHLTRLYTEAAAWVGQPGLTALVDKNQRPVYPLPIETDPPPDRKTKVAVLGSGIGALSAALALTSPKNLKHETYDVTIYQMGWRIGGKGATGRNGNAHQRIEEHGLHLWYGFYNNAFAMMREVFEELGRPPTVPIATFEEAFEPIDRTVLADHFNDTWFPWPSSYPRNDEPLGSQRTFLTLGEYLGMLIQRIHTKSELDPDEFVAEEDDLSDAPDSLREVLRDLIEDLGLSALNLGSKSLILAHRAVERMLEEPDQIAQWLSGREKGVLAWLGRKADSIADRIDDRFDEVWKSIVIFLLDRFIKWFWHRVKGEVHTDLGVHRQWIEASFSYTLAKGMLVDDVIHNGLDSLNHLEFREWLSQYAFDDGGILLGSAAVVAEYSPGFAYVNGNNGIPAGSPYSPNAQIEAGSALNWTLRMILTYHDALMFRFTSGTAETLFTPMYQVLRQRGVKFEFFSRVEELIPKHDGSQIESIRIARQVDLADGIDHYEPLIDINGLPCWPSEPLWDQLADGKSLQGSGINFERTPASWKDAGQIVLTREQAFDRVILGIPPMTFEAICPQLLTKSAKWREMHAAIQSVATIGAQVWQNVTVENLGWADKHPLPALTTFEASPLDTWADMTNLIEQEGWPAAGRPKNLAYFTGTLPQTEPFKITNPNAGDYGIDIEKGYEDALKVTETLLADQFKDFWPEAYEPDGRFRWETLVRLIGSSDDPVDLLKQQYISANVMPSERYVLAVPGSSAKRLPSHDDQEFTNLYLAGDWTDTGINVGCMEAAVMSGLLASEALSGYPEKSRISGHDFGRPHSKK